MTYPWFFRIAFFLGLNRYARIASLKIHQVCGLLVTIYVILVGVKVVGIVAANGFSSVTVFTIIYRTFLTIYFTSVGLLDGCTTTTFYDEILTEIDSSSRKKVYALEDLWCLALFLLVTPEHFTHNQGISVTVIMFIMSSVLNSLVPLVSMTQFSLCCAAVQSSYRRLQHDLLQSVPRTSSFTLRRIRVRQLDIADRTGDVSSVFGLRLFLYILMVQLILLAKIDNLVYKVASKDCDDHCLMVLVTFCGYFVNLWYFSYRPFKAACQHQETLATLMDLDTRDMDVSAMQEMALLAEDLSSQVTRFSAAGCFYVGVHIFYSVIGILFSYVMIIGPLAYNKNKLLWSKDD